jgi:hypothetical protein
VASADEGRGLAGRVKAGGWPAKAGPGLALANWAGRRGPQPAAVSSTSSASPRVRLGSTWIPGLMVLVRMIFLR